MDGIGSCQFRDDLGMAFWRNGLETVHHDLPDGRGELRHRRGREVWLKYPAVFGVLGRVGLERVRLMAVPMLGMSSSPADETGTLRGHRQGPPDS